MWFLYVEGTDVARKLLIKSYNCILKVTGGDSKVEVSQLAVPESYPTSIIHLKLFWFLLTFTHLQ